MKVLRTELNKSKKEQLSRNCMWHFLLTYNVWKKISKMQINWYLLHRASSQIAPTTVDWALHTDDDWMRIWYYANGHWTTHHRFKDIRITGISSGNIYQWLIILQPQKNKNIQNCSFILYLFRDRLDGVVKADTVLIHHPQSFLEGLLEAAANSHHLTCREECWWRSYCHCGSVLMQFKKQQAKVKIHQILVPLFSTKAYYSLRQKHFESYNNIQFGHCLSPTLFMELPILVETLRNLLRSQRGTFTTQ